MGKTKIAAVRYQVVDSFEDGEVQAMRVLSSTKGGIDFYQCGGVDVDGQKYNLIHWYKGDKSKENSFFMMYPVYTS